MSFPEKRLTRNQKNYEYTQKEKDKTGEYPSKTTPKQPHLIKNSIFEQPKQLIPVLRQKRYQPIPVFPTNQVNHFQGSTG